MAKFPLTDTGNCCLSFSQGLLSTSRLSINNSKRKHTKTIDFSYTTAASSGLTSTVIGWEVITRPYQMYPACGCLL